MTAFHEAAIRVIATAVAIATAVDLTMMALMVEEEFTMTATAMGCAADLTAADMRNGRRRGRAPRQSPQVSS